MIKVGVIYANTPGAPFDRKVGAPTGQPPLRNKCIGARFCFSQAVEIIGGGVNRPGRDREIREQSHGTAGRRRLARHCGTHHI